MLFSWFAKSSGINDLCTRESDGRCDDDGRIDDVRDGVLDGVRGDVLDGVRDGVRVPDSTRIPEFLLLDFKTFLIHRHVSAGILRTVFTWWNLTLPRCRPNSSYSLN